MFPRYKEGKVVVEGGVYDTNNEPKRATLKYEQEGLFCIGVAKVESKYNETITGKSCLVLDSTVNIIFTIDAYKQ